MKVAKQTRTGGFTLIELIVVIAILGILAGVGTVAYTGYVKAANKGIDKQTIGDLIYATQLADYANPGLIKEGGTGAMIVISEKGTNAAGGTNTEQLKKALEDSVGSLDAVKLAYMEWAGSIDGATLNSMKDSLAESQIGYMDSTGNVLFKDENGNAATIGYAANADTLWKAVEAAAGFAAADGSKEPGEYLAAMAAYTVGDGATTTGASMGESWSSSDTLTNMSSGNMDVMISSGGMAIARNFAFAEYLKSNDIEVSGNALQILQATPTGIDMNDWLSYILQDKDQAKTRFGDDFEALKNAATAYTTGVYSKEGDAQLYSQAYLDGMIYYALMHNVNKVSTNGTYDPTSKTYLTDIGGYVSLAGSVFSGNTDMASMVELAESLNDSGAETTVVITVTKENGILNFKVKPDDANPRDEETEKIAPTDKTTEITATITGDDIVITPSTIATWYGDTIINTLKAPEGWDIDSADATPSNTEIFYVGIAQGRSGKQLKILQTNYGAGTWGSATIKVTLKSKTDNTTKELSTTIDLYALN